MKAGDDTGPIFGAILYILAGPIIWAGHLLLAYGPQSAVCAFRVTGYAEIERWVVPAFIGGLTLLSVAPLLFLLLRPLQAARLLRVADHAGDDRSFMRVVMQLLAALSLAGVIWAGGTAFILDPCGQLR